MFEPRTAGEQATEEVVRRYLGRLVLRYLPFTLAVAVFFALVIIVPSRSPSTTLGTGGAYSGAVATSGSGGTTTPGASAAASPTGAATAQGAANAATGQGAAATDGVVPQLADVGTPGQTVSGTQCGAGVRQVKWSKYSTLCVSSFHGSNGGATAYGVSPTTITVTFRISDSGEAAAVAAASPALNQQAQDEYFKALAVYVNFFNSQFELYGRHVVMKEFTGQGDWVQEYQGQDPQGAEADAATAHSMGAFADLSSGSVSTTPLYAQYLASDHVVSAGGVAGSDHYFQTNAPFVFNPGASISRLVDAVPNIVCERMKGLPANFSGDAASTKLTRKFGLIFPTNPDFQVVGNAVKAALNSCGTPIGDTYEYAINLSTMASDSTNAMARMRAAGVTTVICLCDTVVPKFLTQAASAQHYHPEWFDSGAADPLGQGYDQSEWAHAIVPGSTVPPANTTEPYRVYLMASHGQQPPNVYYLAAYPSAVLLFDALQNAGPHLTPATFQAGFFGLPPSLPGADYGPWGFGQNHWSAASGFSLGWWSTTATSGVNGTKGAIQSCAGADGAIHAWEPRSTWDPAGTQLHCFGS